MQFELRCCKLGEHDFAVGLETLALRISEANYPFVLVNYDFGGTVLEGKIKPYIVQEKAGLKIGVFGLGIEPGNIPFAEKNKIRYMPPMPVSINVSASLKKDERCDMVICLSHLGYEYQHEKISDKILAAQSENIDLIIGDHTHTFLEKPVKILNKNHEEVIINHAGWGGMNLACLNYRFHSKNSSNFFNAQSVILIKETIAK